MPYPERLVPTSTSIKIPDHEIDSDHHLGMWVSGGKPLQDEDGKLNPEVIFPSRLHNMSSNKIPQSFPDDLRIIFVCSDELQQIYYSEWVTETDGITPPDEDFELDQTKQLYFVRIGDINGFSDSYNNPIDKPDKKYTFTLSVKHAPTKTNFWHFEFALTSTDPSVELKNLNTKGGWKKVVSSSIINVLQENAIFNIE